jgi:predicted amidohydrolase
MKTLHVAAAQVHSGGGVEDTLERMARQVKAAALAGADVILFSECVLQGYDYDLTPARLRRKAEPRDGASCMRVADMARSSGVAVLAGFFERDRQCYYNSVLAARPDGISGVQRKHALTPGEVKAGLSPGPAQRTVFTFSGVRTAIVICADSGIRDLHKTLRRQRVEYRFCPTGGGGKRREMLHEEALRTAEGREAYRENRPRVFKADAILGADECAGIGFASANALGPVGRRTCHQGHCMIVDNRRVMRAQIPGTNVLEHMQDQMIHAELRFGA